MPADLCRFRTRHDQGWHAIAVRELQAGRKTSHWIWWIFPQLDGLGRSPTAREYALRGDDEARAYLTDPLLGRHLEEAMRPVVRHLQAGMGLRDLMGGPVDAQKLVSAMTLFSGVADRADETEGRRAALADTILDFARQQGLPPCAYTRSALGLPSA